MQDQIATTLNPVAQAVASTPLLGAAAPAWIRPDILGGYSQTAAPQPLLAYHKDALGYVHVKVGLTHVAGCAAGTVAAQLELGCRPNETLTFVLSDATGVSVVMTVDAYGQLANLAVLAAATEVRGYLQFLAEQ